MSCFGHVLGRFAWVRPGSRPGLWAVRCPCPAHRHGDRRPSARVWVDEDTGCLKWWCAKGCKWQEAVAATGTQPGDWFPPRVADRPPGRPRKAGVMGAKIVATFDYVDERNQLLYQVCRTDPKGFYQRRPVPGYDGQWAYSLSPGTYTFDQRAGYWSAVVVANPRPPVVELGEVRKVPYHLPELVDAKKKAHPVLVAEGEGKVDLLRELGFVATCSAGGAGKWPVMFGGFLTGRRVVVFPDRDDVGVNHAAQVAASCLLFGAASVRIVRYGMGWEKMPERADVKDWLAEVEKQGADRRASLIDLIKLQPEWKPGGGVS